MIERDINWRLFAIAGSLAAHFLLVAGIWRAQVVTVPERAVKVSTTSVRINFSEMQPVEEKAVSEPKPKPK
ncbi:MAG: hypothetical protein OQK68_08540, partial [Sedimenticola sp.]|nr:hypothetical protein [Sedimenticola sp.]